jgi:two-component system LytT family sensor kinase
MIAIKKKDWIEIVLHIAFWIGVFYTLLSLTESHIKMRIDHNGTIMEKDVRHTLSPHIFLTLGFLIVLFYGNVFWLFKKALYYKNILVRVILPLAWVFTICLANNYLDALLPQNKRDPVMDVLMSSQNKGQPAKHAFGHDQVKVAPPPPPFLKDDRVFAQTKALVFTGNGLSMTVLFVFITIFGLSIAYFFLKEWTKADLSRNQMQANQLSTEIKFLKSQVNPHFLFNTLNNLFSMAQQKGNDELADGISKLSGMMRYMIYESNEEIVPLKKEIEYLENCILLNKLRYADDEVKVIFNYPGQTEGIFIAPMLFIPFVENAFKHGVIIGQSSEIDIAISVADKRLTFNCLNTIYSIKKMEDEQSGIGLENVKRRLELVYADKYKLEIRNDNREYLVELKIDLE